jgi:hypothetical protein
MQCFSYTVLFPVTKTAKITSCHVCQSTILQAWSLVHVHCAPRLACIADHFPSNFNSIQFPFGIWYLLTQLVGLGLQLFLCQHSLLVYHRHRVTNITVNCVSEEENVSIAYLNGCPYSQLWNSQTRHYEILDLNSNKYTQFYNIDIVGWVRSYKHFFLLIISFNLSSLTIIASIVLCTN